MTKLIYSSVQVIGIILLGFSIFNPGASLNSPWIRIPIILTLTGTAMMYGDIKAHQRAIKHITQEREDTGKQ